MRGVTGIWINDKPPAIGAPQPVVVRDKRTAPAQLASDGLPFNLKNIRNATTGEARVIQVKNERVKALVPRQYVASCFFRGLVDASEIKGYVILGRLALLAGSLPKRGAF